MGYIYLYTGTGGGKTANALGLALRSVGHNKKVVIIQFFKWRKDIGEYMIKDKLGSLYEINLAVYWKLLEVKEVLELLNNVPEETTVVMTGRYAPQELIDKADFVN